MAQSLVQMQMHGPGGDTERCCPVPCALQALFTCLLPLLSRRHPCKLFQHLDCLCHYPTLVLRMPMTPGVPAKPMAARICEGVDDGLRLLGAPQCGPFLVEYKYDGVRAQIHLLPDGQVRV